MLKIRSFFIFLSLFAGQALLAATIEPEGEVLTKGKVKWQRVRYEGEESGFTALLPEKPKCEINKKGIASASSKYKGTKFCIFTDTETPYCCPVSEEAFQRQVRSSLKGHNIVSISSLTSNQKNVRYIATVIIVDNYQPEMMRFYASHNHLYYASVKNLGRNDVSLLADFFDSIAITK